MHTKDKRRKRRLEWQKIHRDSRKPGRISHVKTRALQRYDLNLKKEDVLEIGELIRAKRGRYIKEPGPVRVYAMKYFLDYRGKELLVVYDWQNLEVVTVLPNENESS